MTTITSSMTSATGKMRPFDASRDLNAVADLVELCFADTLDADGRRYIQQMRSAARNARYLRWAMNFADNVSMPMAGYVWEENGKLVGNLSIIPLTKHGSRTTLIANVAVDERYRRQGIARALTTTALEDIQHRGIRTVWLQVREGNPAALQLYESLGFQERAIRTTWESAGNSFKAAYVSLRKPPADISVSRYSSQVWPQQQRWLRQAYPLQVIWHLPLNLKVLQPGFSGFLYRFFSGTRQRQWVAWHGQELLGVISWTPGTMHLDHLWLASAPEQDDAAIRALIPYIRRHLPKRRSLDLNYPARRGVQALHDTGFQVRQTLIWMELIFPGTGSKA
jgi:ribosomal protein S18 acetylase RimI-like enzyme